MTVCLALLTPSTMRSPRRVENGLGGWGGEGSHPLSHTNIDKIHASHIILACFSCVTYYIWASAHVTRIPFASLSKDVSQVESEFHTSLPFTVFTLPYLATNGTFILSCCFFFFFTRDLSPFSTSSFPFYWAAILTRCFWVSLSESFPGDAPVLNWHAVLETGQF